MPREFGDRAIPRCDVTPLDLNVKILRKVGVPESAIGYFGNGSKNTGMKPLL
jgi:hypothetical protein